MTTIIVLLLAIPFLLFDLFGAAAGIAGIFSSVANPVAKKLGFQDDKKPLEGLLNTEGVVVSEKGESLRVELAGTSWFARTDVSGFSPKKGDFVKVEKVDGITLVIGPSERLLSASRSQ